jgi:AraC-like DNA-binding protein
VAEYANLLNKSPKTISNVFAILGTKSPLQYIQDRKMLEARRLLNYSSRQIKEIAYEIGFEDIQAFSRFFKKQEGISPSKFKEKNQSG